MQIKRENNKTIINCRDVPEIIITKENNSIYLDFYFGDYGGTISEELWTTINREIEFLKTNSLALKNVEINFPDDGNVAACNPQLSGDK